MSDPRPIILTATQVRAALAGETVELRRKLRPGDWRMDGCTGWNAHQRERVWPAIVWNQAEPSGPGPCWLIPLHGPGVGGTYRICPRIRPGDLLWVQEAWAPIKSGASGPPFKSAVMGWYAGGHDLVGAASDDLPVGCEKWCPAPTMPRWASRLTLVVIGLRLEPGEERPFVVEARRHD